MPSAAGMWLFFWNCALMALVLGVSVSRDGVLVSSLEAATTYQRTSFSPQSEKQVVTGGYTISAEPACTFDTPGVWIDGQGVDAPVSTVVQRTASGTVMLSSDSLNGPGEIVNRNPLTQFFVRPDDTIRLWCYFPNETVIRGMRFTIGQGGLNNAFSSTVADKTVVGWWCFQFRRYQFSAVGNPDWNSPFDSMSISIAGSSPGTLMYVDGVFLNSVARPQVVLTFDDGIESDYTQAYTYLASKRMHGTSFIVPDLVGRSGYLSVPQMQEMYTHGWDFGNHTLSHADLTSLDSEGRQAQILGGRDWLTANGFSRAANYLAYPYGKAAGVTESELSSYGVIAARGGEWSLVETASGLPAPFRIPMTFSPVRTTSLNDAKGIVDAAIGRGQTAMLVFHGLSASPSSQYDWPLDNFRALIDHIATKRNAGLLDVKNFREWYEGITSTPVYLNRPDPFAFAGRTDVSLNTTVESDSVTLSGIGTPAAISIAGGEYSINGGTFTTATGTVNNGDSVAVRLTSSGAYSTLLSAILTIGGVEGAFNVTTIAVSPYAQPVPALGRWGLLVAVVGLMAINLPPRRFSATSTTH